MIHSISVCVSSILPLFVYPPKTPNVGPMFPSSHGPAFDGAHLLWLVYFPFVHESRGNIFRNIFGVNVEDLQIGKAAK